MITGRQITHRTFQVNALDGLRGLAVALVFLSHTSNKNVPLESFVNLAGVGKSGVYLFFTLSAFLLTYPFIALGGQAFSLRALANYFLRRFLRIYPLLILYLLLALATSQPFFYKATGGLRGLPFLLKPSDLFQCLLLLRSKGVTWSIAVEFQFYFVLPVLAFVAAVAFRRRILPALILTVSLVILATLIWPPGQTPENSTTLGYYLPIFLIGSFLAVAHYAWNQPATHGHTRLGETLWEILGWAGVLGMIALIPSVARSIPGLSSRLINIHQQFLAFALCCSAMVFACLNGRGPLRRVFEFPALRFLGFISFSVYLIHPLLIKLHDQLGWNLPFAGWWILAATIALSLLSFSLVERPFSRIRLRTGAG
jgi:peptidoglycan/LPS O-acetylase OafA/YrhL